MIWGGEIHGIVGSIDEIVSFGNGCLGLNYVNKRIRIYFRLVEWGSKQRRGRDSDIGTCRTFRLITTVRMGFCDMRFHQVCRLSRPRRLWVIMNINETQFIGSLVAGMSSLLGAYYLTLRIREMFAEKPDPKLTYATKAEMERVRVSMDEMRREWNAGRAVIEERSNGALASVHELIRRNAEHIAVLIAQAEMFDRRITETAQRVDRLGERIGR